MPENLNRIGRGALLLVSVVIIAILGFRILGNYSWIESVWMVVVTISTVGYSERSALDPSMQIFVILVILLGISASAYTLGGLIQLMLEGEVDRLLGIRRMTREIKQLENHVIICGFGRIGRNLAAELHRAQKPFLILESNEKTQQEATEKGYRCVVGDASEESVLRNAGIERAKTLVSGLGSDAENVFITLTARNMNPSLQIISRAETPSTERKLAQAGANQVVMPTIVGARLMSRMITRPTTADLFDLLSQSCFEDLEMDEIALGDVSPIIGSSVGETEAHRKHKLLIVAIKHTDGQLLFNPDATQEFQSHDTVIVMGHAKDIERFRVQYDLPPQA